MAVKEQKEPTVVTLKAKLKNLLDYYFPENNFVIKLQTEHRTNTLFIFVEGCAFSEEKVNQIKKFVDYFAPRIVRKKATKEENKITYAKIHYEKHEIFFWEDCTKYTYFKGYEV